MSLTKPSTLMKQQKAKPPIVSLCPLQKWSCHWGSQNMDHMRVQRWQSDSIMKQAAEFIRKKLARHSVELSHWPVMRSTAFEGTPDIPVDNLFHSSARCSKKSPDRSTRTAL